MKRNLVFYIFLLLAISTTSFSQDFIDTEGKDFWLTFIPNYHNDNSANRTDSLQIFISSKVPTTGTIDYKDASGRAYTMNFSISDPSKIHSFSITFYNYELEGFNDGSRIQSSSQNEEVAKQSFHITSKEEVTVYALNQASLTSEAFLVVPTDALGKEYYVLAYNSDGKTLGSSWIDESSTPSQFAIVATEDNTNISINPSVATYKNGNKVQNIILQKGEVYLVQSDIDRSNLNLDLTGSLVKADKPVAVFAGQQRATLPVDDFSQPSRDCLIEQMIPIKSWGKNAIVVPFVQPTPIVPNGNDLYRVLAANDNTKVTIDGSTITLNAGKYIENELSKATFIEADGPIMVAQYKKSANNSGGSTNYVSDPLMLVVSPVEQYISSYRVINAQGKSEVSSATIKAYDKQYVTVIGDKLATTSLTIDGASKPFSDFKQVEQTAYYWANFEVSDGVHNLNSKGKFAVFVYGYGYANSYGYLGGMGLVVLDLVPPKIFSSIDCDKLEGVVTDSTLSDSKIASITAENIINTKVNIPNFTPYQSIVKFDASLINKFLDGEFLLKTKDSVLSESNQTIRIPGFTIGLEPAYNANELTYKFDFGVGKQNCFDVKFYNYGQSIKQVANYQFKNNSDKLIPNFTGPFLLNPGETRTITYCVKSDVELTLLDTLLIGNDCAERTVANYKINFFSDTLAPRFSSENDICNTEFTYTFIEDSPFDFGIDKLTIVSTNNCKITSNKTGNRLLEVFVNVTDSYEDADFEIIVSDLNGLETTIKKEIPGFTLSFASIDTTNSRRMDDTQIGAASSKTIELTNYGKFTISVDDIFLSYNIIFSVPQSQIPFVLAAGETRALQVYFAPTSSKDSIQFDTLSIGMNCLYRKMPIEGKSLPFEFGVTSKCDIDLVFSTDSVARGVSISPMPLINQGKIQIDMTSKGDVSIYLFDSYGSEIKEIFIGKQLIGQLNISLETDGLSSGVYFLQVRTNGYTKNVPIIIQK